MSRFILVVVCLLTFASAHAQFSRVPASTNLEHARRVVLNAHPAPANLVSVLTARFQVSGLTDASYINRDGNAAIWVYVFYTPTDDYATVVVALGDGTVVTLGQEVPNASQTGDTAAILDGWVDSPASMAAFMQQQAGTFLDTKSGARIESYGLIPQGTYTTAPTWSIMCVAEPDTLICGLNALTAEVVSCHLLTDVELIPSRASFSIGQVYPSPLRALAEAQIGLIQTNAQRLRVSVHDVMGRELGVLTDALFLSGNSTITIPGYLLHQPGIYFVHISNGSEIAVRKIIVTR